MFIVTGHISEDLGAGHTDAYYQMRRARSSIIFAPFFGTSDQQFGFKEPIGCIEISLQNV